MKILYNGKTPVVEVHSKGIVHIYPHDTVTKVTAYITLSTVKIKFRDGTEKQFVLVDKLEY